MTVDEAINILRKKSRKLWATDIFYAYETNDMFIFSVGRKGVVLVTNGFYCNINKKTKRMSHDRIFTYKELMEQQELELSEEQKIIKKLKPKKFKNCLKKEDALELTRRWAQRYGYIDIAEMYETDDRWIVMPFGETARTNFDNSVQIFKADRQLYPIHGSYSDINRMLETAQKVDLLNMHTTIEYNNEQPLIKKTKDTNTDNLKFILSTYHPNSVPMLEMLIRGYYIEVKGSPLTEQEQLSCWCNTSSYHHFKDFQYDIKQEIENYNDDFRINMMIFDQSKQLRSIMLLKKDNECIFIDPQNGSISYEFDIHNDNIESIRFQRIDHLMYSEHMKEYYDVKIPPTNM